MTRGWRSITHGILTTDQMVRIIQNQVKESGYHGVTISLATDGQVKGQEVAYETAVVVRMEQKGAFFFTWGCAMRLPPRQKSADNRGMADAISRLPLEATISRAIADILHEKFLAAKLPHATTLVIALDVNPDEQHRSSRVLMPCQAMVAGYDSVVKPASQMTVRAADRANKKRWQRNLFTPKDTHDLYGWVQRQIQAYDAEHGETQRAGQAG